MSEGNNDSPVEDNWRLKVLVSKMDGIRIIPEEKVMEVQTKLTDKNKKEYKINSFQIK